MAPNDVVLLDSLVDKLASVYGPNLDLSERFELFTFDQILKDAELSYEEMEAGWVDSGDDGGIDGFFVLLDGKILTEEPDIKLIRRNASLEVIVVTSKHGDQFRQIPLNNLIGSLPELFDLRKDSSALLYPFVESVTTARDLFKNTYLSIAEKNPSLTIRVVYASRGDTTQVNPNVTARAGQLKEQLEGLFSNVNVTVGFLGAAELLQMARRQKTYSHRLAFVENNISRGKTNYVILSPLLAYFKFTTDEEGRLRRYLFEANVRDYLGEVQVNRDIMDTLSGLSSKEDEDFWWLNNGITLLASNATIAGKELSLENVQIVNGLQTTETIYRYFSEHPAAKDDRAILIKIIITDNDEIRDKIIKATNYQNGVEIASLRATDPIQRNIEHFLQDHNWYYDRRKNFHKNQGRPAERIVSMSAVGSAIRALVLREPAVAVRERTKWMRDDDQYSRIFNSSWNLGVFLACVEIVKAVDLVLRDEKKQRPKFARRQLNSYHFLISLVYVCQKLRSVSYAPNDLAPLVGSRPSSSDVNFIIGHLAACAASYGSPLGRNRKRARPGAEFSEFVVAELKRNNYQLLPAPDSEEALLGHGPQRSDGSIVGARVSTAAQQPRRRERNESVSKPAEKWWKFW